MRKRSLRPNERQKKKNPYSKSSDDEKVVRNWRKCNGLFDRNEYSIAILRCATCIELAMNLAIREELAIERDLPLTFVNKLLKNANGLRNKYLNLFLPKMDEYDTLKNLWKSHINKTNQQCNAIAHSGEFRSRKIAEEIMTDTNHALIVIMELYDFETKIKLFKS